MMTLKELSIEYNNGFEAGIDYGFARAIALLMSKEANDMQAQRSFVFAAFLDEKAMEENETP